MAELLDFHLALAPSADGRLELFVLGTNGNLYYMSQTAPSNGWSTLLSQGLPPAVALSSDPALGRNADGRLEFFVGGKDGALYHMSQTAPSNGWSTLLSQGLPPGVVLSSDPVLAVNADGRLELFCVGDGGTGSNLYHMWQTTPGGSWSEWLSLGNPAPIMGFSTPALGRSADGRLELFCVGGGGLLYHMWQTTPGGSWSGWLSHGDPSGRGLVGPPALASNADGRLELFCVGDDKLYHIWQTAPSGSWSGWFSQGQPSTNVRLESPALASNADGRLELFVVSGSGGGGGNLYHIWQTTPNAIPPNGRWSGWSSLGDPSRGGLVGTPGLAPSADGRLELFVVAGAQGGNGNLYHIWQSTPNGSWSEWLSHGHP
jgi:hypothetical protein